MSRFLISAALLQGVALFGPFAQSGSQLSGVITGKTGAAVPGAGIAASNASTGVEQKATTNATGIYTLPLLNPGEYKVSVSKAGFKPLSRPGIRLEVNQSENVDFSLEACQWNGQVTVTESAPLLESTNSSIGQVIESKAIEDLPLNGRNFVQFAVLGPGVSGVGFGSKGTIMSRTRPDDPRPGSELFANGNRAGANNFLMDGVDNNDRLTLSIALRPSVESVREFKIQTSMLSAGQGRNSCATVSVVTKSGTNQRHGSAYEFLRNGAMDAKNFFTRPEAKIPAFRQNQFGVSIGAAAITNRLFFFANYEGFQRRRERLFVTSVPSEAMRRGDFSGVRNIFNPYSLRRDTTVATGYVRDAFPNRRIPANLFDSVMSRMIQAYPAAQSTALVNNLTMQPKESQQWNQRDGRLDYTLNERNVFFGRFSRQDTVTTRPSTSPNRKVQSLDALAGLGNEDTFAGDSVLKAYNAGGAWVRTLTPALLMEARIGFSRFNLDFRWPVTPASGRPARSPSSGSRTPINPLSP